MAGIFSNKKLEAARAAAAAEAEASAVGAPVATADVAPRPHYTAGASYAAPASATATAPAPAPGDNVRQSLSGKFVCPFCGSVNENEQGTCPRCTMENTAASRKATKIRIGPWYVLQTRNPAAPGMKFETLLSFVKKGRVKPASIVRGPTTHQLWRFAAQVKGLSREFGVCYSCGTSIDRAASICPQCNRLQDPPPYPDVLLEAGKEGAATPGSLVGTPTAPGAPPAPGVPANGATPAGAGGASARSQEPSLETGEEDFVVPAIGGAGAAGHGANLSDSMAGFSMSDSLSGAVIDQPWARIDPNRSPSGAAGNGRGPAGGRPATPRQPVPPGPGAPGYNPTTGYTPASPGPGQGAPYGYGEGPYGQPPAGGRRPGPAAPAPGAAAGFGANGRPQRAEGFLSARDLAAAFKLQLADDDPDAAPRGPVVAAPRSPYASPPADFGPTDADALFNPPSFGHPRRRKRKIAVVLLLMALAALGIALAVSEDLRHASMEWFGRAKANLDADPSKANVTGDDAGPSDSAATADGSKAFPRGGTARPASSRLPGTTQPAATTRPSSTNRAAASGPQANAIFADPDSATPAASSNDASLSAHPMTASPDVTTTAAAPPAPTSPAARASDGWDSLAVAASAPQPATRPADSAAAVDLYRKAIDAESRGDWAGAVERYQTVKTYPRQTWPSDLDTRLRIAQGQVKTKR